MRSHGYFHVPFCTLPLIVTILGHTESLKHMDLLCNRHLKALHSLMAHLREICHVVSTIRRRESHETRLQCCRISLFISKGSSCISSFLIAEK
jgi:hypothetical protein